MVQWLLLLALPLFSLAVSAGDGSSSAQNTCEVAMETVLTLTRAALEHHALTPEDIEYMLGDPQTVRNPYLRNTKDPQNIFFRQKFERNFQKISAEGMPLLRTRLVQLYKAGAKDREQIADAREKTEYIIAPKLIKIPELLNVSKDLQTSWHKDRNGDLQLVSYDPFEMTLKIFPLANLRSPVRQSLTVTGFVQKHPLQGITRFLSLPDGNLIVAHLNGAKNQIVIHDVDADKSVLVDLGERVENLHLAQGPNKKVYVIAQGIRTFSTYEVENSEASQIHHASVPEILRGFQVVTSRDGQILLVYSENTRVVHMVNPINKVDRTFQSKDLTENISAMFLPDGNYVVALTSRARNSPRRRVTFLDSQSSEARFTPYYSSDATIAGNLIRTANGKVYTTIGNNVRSPKAKDELSSTFTFNIHVYDAFQMPRNGNLWNRVTGTSPTLTPDLILEGGEGSAQESNWLKPAPGRLVFTQISSPQLMMRIYEPLRSLESLSDFRTQLKHQYSAHPDDFKVELTPVLTPSKYVVQIHSLAENKTEFFDATHPPIKVGEIPHRSILPAVVDRRGLTYILTDTSFSGNARSAPHNIYLYQLTVGDPR